MALFFQQGGGVLIEGRLDSREPVLMGLRRSSNDCSMAAKVMLGIRGMVKDECAGF